MLKRNFICYICIAASLCTSAFASSGVAIVTSQAILVGIDGKTVDRCIGPCSLLRHSKKIVFVQDRVVLGTVGLYAVLGDAHNVPPYYFPALAGRVRSRVTRDAAVDRISEIVKEETLRFSAGFDLYLKRGLVQRKDYPGDYPVEYLVAGYQAGVPTIYSVGIDVDWQQLHMKGVQQVVLHPKIHLGTNFDIYSIGSKRVLQQLRDRQGELYRRVLSKAPLESQMLIDKKQLSVKQATTLIRALLELEAEVNPEQVGPPFTIVTIRKFSAP